MWNDAEGHSRLLGGPIVNSHEGRILSLRFFSPLQAGKRDSCAQRRGKLERVFKSLCEVAG
jgi:hypothetical protein